MTEAKKVNYDSTNRAKYYDAQKKKSYTEKTVTTYADGSNGGTELESSNGKKFYSEDEDEIILMDASNATSTASIKMWMVDKKKGEYYEIDMSGFPMNPGDITNPGTSSTVTETLKGYYKIGANTYPAECFATTTKYQGYTWRDADIYCYNGGKYPVYIAHLTEVYDDVDDDGNVTTSLQETSLDKIDFQEKANASLMDFNSILKKYKNGGKKTWSDLYT